MTYTPPPITGYQTLSAAQVNLINSIKGHEKAMALILAELMEDPPSEEVYRWLEAARTHLETGYMYACKAVAQPKGGMGTLSDA